jgi:hypothetical protein
MFKGLQTTIPDDQSEGATGQACTVRLGSLRPMGSIYILHVRRVHGFDIPQMVLLDTPYFRVSPCHYA